MRIINNIAIISTIKNVNDILPELAEQEYSISIKYPQITHIRLELDENILINNSSRLKKLHYKLHDGYYEKHIVVQNSARFSITEKCNYKCFFCHEEGLEMGKQRHDKPIEETFQIIKQLKEHNCVDFTFTGGEPLLKFDKIVSCLEYMESIDYMPEITIVTNGVAITDKVINYFNGKWKNKIRFNISMHSLDDVNYGKIVEPNKAEIFAKKLHKVQENLLKLKDAGIVFKLNFVLLKGLNTEPEQLYQILDYAAESGATHVKFLELLITDNLRRFYPYYYKLEAIYDILRNDLHYIDSDARRDTYQYKNTKLRVELQTCTCAQGCNACLLSRHMNFTAENKYFPCFLRPDFNLATEAHTLSELLPKGEQFILNMGKKYGDFSPILIRDGNFVNSENNYYYQIDATNITKFRETLKLAKFMLDRIDEKEEFYFSEQINDKVAYIDKYIKSNHEKQVVEVLSMMEMEDNKILTTFNSNVKNIVGNELIEKIKYAKFKLNWQFEFYSNKTDELQISIGHELNSKLSFIRSNQELPENLLANIDKLASLPIYLAMLNAKQ